MCLDGAARRVTGQQARASLALSGTDDDSSYDYILADEGHLYRGAWQCIYLGGAARRP